MIQDIAKEIEFFSNIAPEPVFDEKIVKRVLELSNVNKKVLDCGCGSGYWGRMFANQECNVVGVDLSKKIIDRARKKAKANQSFIVGDISKDLPLSKKYFDLIFYGGVLHHFPSKSEVEKVIKNLSKYLKTGGKLILVEPNGSNPIVFFSRLFGVFLVKHLRMKIASINEKAHFTSVYVNALKNNGFKILVSETHGFYMPREKIKLNSLFNLLLIIRRFLLKFSEACFPLGMGGDFVIIVGKMISR